MASSSTRCGSSAWQVEAELEIPDELVPVFEGDADVRGSHGGRGSGKSRTFAKMTAVRAYMWDMAGRTGIILCARQFQNSLSDSSLEEIKTAIRETPWLLPHFDIGETYVRTKSGRISYSSPLGRALIGKSVGDEIEVTVPSGDRFYLVDKVEFK